MGGGAQLAAAGAAAAGAAAAGAAAHVQLLLKTTRPASASSVTRLRLAVTAVERAPLQRSSLQHSVYS